MGLEKAIEHGKEKRKPYKGGKAIDRTCRNHGDDSIALNNKTRRDERRGKKHGCE